MTVSGFLSKTFDIFSDPENADICSWGGDGDTIHVKKIDEFSKTILPKYFKHSNFQSFVRQLNMYDFHKTVQDPGNGEFTHINFRQNRPDLLSLIKRKAHNKHELRAKQQQQQSRINSMPDELTTAGTFSLLESTPHALIANSVSNNSSSSGGGGNGNGNGSGLGGSNGGGAQPHSADSMLMLAALEQEQIKQKRIRDDFEWRLNQLEAQKARIYELEAQQGRLSGENYMLKHMLQDSRVQQNQLQNKMEGVLKLMYHAFVNSKGNGNGSAIGNGIPESRLMEFCSFLNVSGSNVLQLESGDTLNSNGVIGGRSSGGGDTSGVSSLLDNEIISSHDIDDFLHNGEISSDLMAASSVSNGAKRKLPQVEGLDDVDVIDSAGAAGISGTSWLAPSPTSLLTHAPSIHSPDGVDEYPKLEKVVSFDSLAGHIRPNLMKPPLGTNHGSSKASMGEFGINSSPPNSGLAVGHGLSLGVTGGGILSRQHSLELPPAGQSISGGYHYTPLSTVHNVKKQKVGGDTEESSLSRGRLEGQPLSRGASLIRQDSEESLGLPLSHLDSMDSTLASLFDISDHPDDQETSTDEPNNKYSQEK